MKGMSLEAVAAACEGIYIGADELKKREIRGVSTDSRSIGRGELFIPIVGERVDGHKFLGDVFRRGAVAVLSEQLCASLPGPCILVKSTKEALIQIAAYYRSTLDIPIVGVSGSVGKTGTKEMIASVLSQKYNVLKTEGNLNNAIGLPLTILKIRDEHEAAVIEMGISDFGEMHILAGIARPGICVLTNIAPCHLEQLGSLEGVLKAKSEIFDYLKEDGAIILNGSDEMLSKIGKVRGISPIRYLIEKTGENIEYLLQARVIENLGLDGFKAELAFPDETVTVHVPVPGEHNLHHVCAAACVGTVLGMTYGEIKDGIAAAEDIPGRMRVLHTGGYTLIDDCYNASPLSMRAAIDVLSAQEGRKIAVLGDMGELGEDGERLHREIGVYAAKKSIDIVLSTGRLCEGLSKEASASCDSSHYGDTDALTEAIKAMIRPGDTVLVKASHFMNFSKIVEKLDDSAEKPEKEKKKEKEKPREAGTDGSPARTGEGSIRESRSRLLKSWFGNGRDKRG